MPQSVTHWTAEMVRALPDDERPEVLSESITWHPEGAASPLTIDLPLYFARVHRETW